MSATETALAHLQAAKAALVLEAYRGTRCTCCCRKCSARFHHKLARPLPEDAE